VLVAIAYGVLAGRLLRPTRCGAIAGSMASVAMLVVSGGPLTRTSPRALMIGLSLLPVACVYAAAYVAIARVITAGSRDSSPLAPR
jgi:drug/metabolite transporter (DMT)-like permease